MKESRYKEEISYKEEVRKKYLHAFVTAVRYWHRLSKAVVYPWKCSKKVGWNFEKSGLVEAYP